MQGAFVVGVIVGIFVSVVVALNVLDRRHPVTPEQQAEVDQDRDKW
jgi:hypothetical protein